MKHFLPLYVFAFLLSSSCGEATDPQEKYVEFEHIDAIYMEFPALDDPDYQLNNPNEAAKRQKANLAAVLVYHGVPINYTTEGRITIPESVASDSAFIQRLLTKAKDTAWYRERIFPK